MNTHSNDLTTDNYSLPTEQNFTQQEPPEKKRKRNKQIKSCLECRKRKLRCDRKIPKCSSCISRNLTECLYVNHENHIVNYVTGESLGKLQNNGIVTINSSPEGTSNTAVANNDEIDDKSKNQDHNCNKKHENNNTLLKPEYNKNDTSAEEENPILKLETAVFKNNRIIYFGATSIRCFSSLSSENNFPFLVKILKELKKIRKYEKVGSNYSTLKELVILDNNQEGTVFEEIIELLPDYNTFKTCVEFFFRTVYHEYFPVTNENVIKKQLSTLIKYDPRTNKITGFIHPGKRNYYAVAILIILFSLVYYTSGAPDAILKLFVLLDGCSTSKSLTLEKAQLLVFRTIFRVYHGFTGGDFSHLLNLVGNLCSTCISLGLHRNYRKIYHQSEIDRIGGIEVLDQIWYWALYFDVMVSFQVGKALFISRDLYDHNVLLKSINIHDNEMNRKELIMKKFIIISREIIIDLFKPTGKPSLALHKLRICEFLDTYFQPLNYYSNPELSLKHVAKINNNYDIFDYLFVGNLVAKYAGLSCLEKLVYNNTGNEVENDIIRSSLILYELGPCLVSICLKREKQLDYIRPSFCSSKSYIILSFGISKLCSIGITYLYFFFNEKCEYNKQNGANIPTDEEVREEIKNFKVDLLGSTDKNRNFKTLSPRAIFNIICEYFEKWWPYETEALQQLTRFYLQFIYKKIFEKVTMSYLANSYKELTVIGNKPTLLTGYAIDIPNNIRRIKILTRKDAGEVNDEQKTNDKDKTTVVGNIDTNSSADSDTPNTGSAVTSLLDGQDLSFDYTSSKAASLDTGLDHEIYRYFNCSENEFFDLLNQDLENFKPST
ncbi:uncharacterized protein SCDLUD_001663 [Saccharomycodes ludwigii]|uniref:uncharacterized protein n=1 Tax=Saccharomycodes ludwigii TaxID=36035 RepID=UPI001E84CC6C|nr:hypothetical protein SCDLUD_001663 [Saccharomycodes ludwigii]KAH3901879.1 hypothetical protein SCDLUD_001663 [Saccharomycodes ludwigii]